MPINKFRYDVEFRQHQLIKPKNLEEACEIIHTLGNMLNNTHSKLQSLFPKLEGVIGKTGNTSIILSAGAGGTSGSSSVASDALGRIVPVVAGLNSISFLTARTSDYILILEFYDADGIPITLSPAPPTYTVSGFDITLDQVGFLKYVTIPKET
jgi:hypothetical protein